MTEKEKAITRFKNIIPGYENIPDNYFLYFATKSELNRYLKEEAAANGYTLKEYKKIIKSDNYIFNALNGYLITMFC